MTVSSGSNVSATAHFVDVPSSPGSNSVSSNGSTPVTVVPAPSPGTTRLVQYIGICNNDSGGQETSVFIGAIKTVKQILAPSGGALQYATNSGWCIPFTTSSILGATGPQGSIGATGIQGVPGSTGPLGGPQGATGVQGPSSNYFPAGGW